MTGLDELDAVIAQALDERELRYRHKGVGAFFVTLPGVKKLATNCWLVAGRHAFVIEAPYEDFLDPKKTRPYSASFCAAAIAQVYSSHPRLRLVFCTNRKTANEWTRNYFSAVWNQRADSAKSRVAERQAPWELES